MVTNFIGNLIPGEIIDLTTLSGKNEIHNRYKCFPSTDGISSEFSKVKKLLQLDLFILPKDPNNQLTAKDFVKLINAFKTKLGGFNLNVDNTSPFNINVKSGNQRWRPGVYFNMNPFFVNACVPQFPIKPVDPKESELNWLNFFRNLMNNGIAHWPEAYDEVTWVQSLSATTEKKGLKKVSMRNLLEEGQVHPHRFDLLEFFKTQSYYQYQQIADYSRIRTEARKKMEKEYSLTDDNTNILGKYIGSIGSYRALCNLLFCNIELLIDVSGVLANPKDGLEFTISQQPDSDSANPVGSSLWGLDLRTSQCSTKVLTPKNISVKLQLNNKDDATNKYVTTKGFIKANDKTTNKQLIFTTFSGDLRAKQIDVATQQSGATDYTDTIRVFHSNANQMWVSVLKAASSVNQDIYYEKAIKGLAVEARVYQPNSLDARPSNWLSLNLRRINYSVNTDLIHTKSYLNGYTEDSEGSISSSTLTPGVVSNQFYFMASAADMVRLNKWSLSVPMGSDTSPAVPQSKAVQMNVVDPAKNEYPGGFLPYYGYGYGVELRFVPLLMNGQTMVDRTDATEDDEAVIHNWGQVNGKYQPVVLKRSNPIREPKLYFDHKPGELPEHPIEPAGPATDPRVLTDLIIQDNLLQVHNQSRALVPDAQNNFIIHSHFNPKNGVGWADSFKSNALYAQNVQGLDKKYPKLVDHVDLYTKTSFEGVPKAISKYLTDPLNGYLTVAIYDNPFTSYHTPKLLKVATSLYSGFPQDIRNKFPASIILAPKVDLEGELTEVILETSGVDSIPVSVYVPRGNTYQAYLSFLPFDITADKLTLLPQIQKFEASYYLDNGTTMESIASMASPVDRYNKLYYQMQDQSFRLNVLSKAVSAGDYISPRVAVTLYNTQKMPDAANLITLAPPALPVISYLGNYLFPYPQSALNDVPGRSDFTYFNNPINIRVKRDLASVNTQVTFEQIYFPGRTSNKLVANLIEAPALLNAFEMKINEQQFCESQTYRLSDSTDSAWQSQFVANYYKLRDTQNNLSTGYLKVGVRLDTYNRFAKYYEGPPTVTSNVVSDLTVNLPNTSVPVTSISPVTTHVFNWIKNRADYHPGTIRIELKNCSADDIFAFVFKLGTSAEPDTDPANPKDPPYSIWGRNMKVYPSKVLGHLTIDALQSINGNIIDSAFKQDLSNYFQCAFSPKEDFPAFNAKIPILMRNWDKAESGSSDYCLIPFTPKNDGGRFYVDLEFKESAITHYFMDVRLALTKFVPCSHRSTHASEVFLTDYFKLPPATTYEFSDNGNQVVVTVTRNTETGINLVSPQEQPVKNLFFLTQEYTSTQEEDTQPLWARWPCSVGANTQSFLPCKPVLGGTIITIKADITKFSAAPPAGLYNWKRYILHEYEVYGNYDPNSGLDPDEANDVLRKVISVELAATYIP